VLPTPQAFKISVSGVDTIPTSRGRGPPQARILWRQHHHISPRQQCLPAKDVQWACAWWHPNRRACHRLHPLVL